MTKVAGIDSDSDSDSAADVPGIDSDSDSGIDSDSAADVLILGIKYPARGGVVFY